MDGMGKVPGNKTCEEKTNQLLGPHDVLRSIQTHSLALLGGALQKTEGAKLGSFFFWEFFRTPKPKERFFCEFCKKVDPIL